MSNEEIVMYAAGVIVASILYVARFVLAYYKQEKALKSFDKYKPFALMAAKWVESKVPDDYGVGSEDPSYAKAAHKLDLFLKKFNDIVLMQEGKAPSKALKAEAMSWSVELAERMNLSKGLTDGILGGVGEVVNGTDGDGVREDS